MRAVVLVLIGAVCLASATSNPIAHTTIALRRGMDVQGDEDGEQIGSSFAQMTNYRNTQYTGTVHVGTPPQQFNVILDTGSANFWVYSAECTTPACKAHHQFDMTKSETYSTNRTSFFVKYGSGRINGVLAQDNIQLGSLVVPQQIFGAVTRETGSAFMWGKYDGILGLAFPSLAIEGSQPVLDTIIQQGLITPMFSFYFSSGKSDSAFYVGGVPPAYAHHTFNWHPVIRKGYWEIGLDDMTLDGVSLAACPRHIAQHEKSANKRESNAQTQAAFARSDSGSYPVVYENMQLGSSGDLTTQDETEDGFIAEIQSAVTEESELGAQVWMALSVSSSASVCVQATSAVAMGTKHTIQSRMCSQVSSAHQAPPLTKFPENDANYNQDTRCKAAVDTGTSLITGPSESITKLQEMMGQVTNCEDLSNLPTVVFVIDGVKYPLTPQQYVLQFEAEDGQPASCLLGFKALDVPPPRGPLWVLGDVFMRAYFSVFDRSQNRIGLTKANMSPSSPNDPTPHTPDLEQLPIGIDTDSDAPFVQPQQQLQYQQYQQAPYQQPQQSQPQPQQPQQSFQSLQSDVTTTPVAVIVDETIQNRPPAPRGSGFGTKNTQSLIAQQEDDDDDFWQQY